MFLRSVPALALAVLALPAWAQVTVTLGSETVAPKMGLGIGVNGGGDQYHLVGANLVDDSSFEGTDSKGFATNGWPWFATGTITPSVDTTTFVTGKQSQRIEVTASPASMSQGRADLKQSPVVLLALPGRTYRIRAQVKSDHDGATVRLGLLDDNWQGRYGPRTSVGTDWQVVTFDYVPEAAHLIRGVSVRYDDVATYWIDDSVAWDTADLDPATGLSAGFVERLKELAPTSLRLGGLGMNAIPLETFLRPTWKPDYGPPVLQPELDLNTFLALCKEVGAVPFFTVPPAFSDPQSAKIGDLTHDVIDSHYADHGNLVDYIGGDATTEYGARREHDGFPRWDTQFPAIDFELGNEVWGTPDGKWDMNVGGSEALLQQMQNYSTYCQKRIGEMKSREGWRGNMKVGFGGRNPTIWIGGWPGSYDRTLVPVLKGITDFSTTDLYFGKGNPDMGDSDADIYSGLFAGAFARGRDISTMKAAFYKAQSGTDLETMVYEGAAEWHGYENDLTAPSTTYQREVSLGAAVALVDILGAANRAGVTLANHFHMTANAWEAVGPWPDLRPKPAFLAVQLFSRYLAGQMVDCTVTGAGTFDDALTAEKAVPDLACYAYHQADRWDVLLVNRKLAGSTDVTIQKDLAPLGKVSLTGADIRATNETGDKVKLTTELLSGVLGPSVTVTVPPFSAVAVESSDLTGGGDGAVEYPPYSAYRSHCSCGSGEGISGLALLVAGALLRRRPRANARP